jgi:rubredoxin
MPRPEELICPDCGGRKSRQAPRCAKCSGEGNTSEQRDHLSTPLCGARKKTGEECRAFAGQGTPHLGVGNC